MIGRQAVADAVIVSAGKAADLRIRVRRGWRLYGCSGCDERGVLAGPTGVADGRDVQARTPVPGALGQRVRPPTIVNDARAGGGRLR